MQQNTLIPKKVISKKRTFLLINFLMDKIEESRASTPKQALETDSARFA
jgi:hypothetical protein